jgi:hypothetical protein
MKARFQQIRRDMFWEIFDGKDFVKWNGYDDAYWWENVANSDQFQIRGKYRLNPHINEVTEIKEKQDE